MPQITIPIGSKVSQNNENTIEIRIPGTKFWVEGKKMDNNLWDIYVKDPQTGYRELTNVNITTLTFSRLSNTILKSPFPYEGKRAESSELIKKFIKKIIKKCKTTQQH